MIDKIIDYLYYHPNITTKMLHEGLKVSRQEIDADFVTLFKDDYIKDSRKTVFNSTGGTISTQLFRLSPKGTEYFHKVIEPSKAKTKTLKEENDNMGAKKIFISHAYNAKGIVSKLIDKLIIPNFDINKERDIFFTSNRSTGIRSSLNWRNKIKTSLKECKIFIVIITPDFKNSEMCLGEIGAAWVLDKSIHPLIIPPIKFYDFNAIISEIQAENLFEKDNIVSFINSISEDLLNLYKIQRKLDQQFESNVTAFHKYIKKHNKTNL